MGLVGARAAMTRHTTVGAGKAFPRTDIGVCTVKTTPQESEAFLIDFTTRREGLHQGIVTVLGKKIETCDGILLS